MRRKTVTGQALADWRPKMRRRATRENLVTRDHADVAAFAVAQSKVARHVLGMSDRWAARLSQDRHALQASDPLIPELWSALFMERRLVADMFLFRFRVSPTALEPYWLVAKGAQLRLNYTLSVFHNELLHEGADEMRARLGTVQRAAEAVLSNAGRMTAAMHASSATDDQPDLVWATGEATRPAREA